MGCAARSTWLKERGAVGRWEGVVAKGERGASTHDRRLSAQPGDGTFRRCRHVKGETTPETHNQLTSSRVQATNPKQSLAWDVLLESVCWAVS